MEMNRNERLAGDFCGMLAIQDRPYLSWIAAKGELPYAEEYLLTAKIRTYALSASEGRYNVGVIDKCVIRITLWDSYPYVAPSVRMLNIPPVFHPDWYSKGTYCPSEPWTPDMALKDFVLRMLGTLKYDRDIMGMDTPANYKALDWYIKNQDSSLFPSDTVELTENSAEEIEKIEKDMLSFGEIIDSWGR